MRKTAPWRTLCATATDPIDRNSFSALMGAVSAWGISAACYTCPRPISGKMCTGSRIESPRSKRSWRMGIGQLIGAVLVGSAIGYAAVKHTLIAQAERARIEDEAASLLLIPH